MKHSISGHSNHRKHKPKKSEQVYTDPVCGMQISYKNAPAILEYRGRVYCFCADICRETFEKNPDAYLSKRKKPVDADRRLSSQTDG